MPPVDSPPLATNDEIEAALAEAQAQAEGIPSLDPVEPGDVVPVPVETDAATATRLRPLAKPRAPEIVVTDGPIRAAADVAATPRSTGTRGRGIGGSIYAVLDRALWLTNVPFAWLPGGLRRAAGYVGLTSIVVSLVCLWVLPRFLQPRDLGTFVKEQVAAMRAAAAAPKPEAPAEAEAHGKPEAPAKPEAHGNAGGHAAAKAPAKPASHSGGGPGKAEGHGKPAKGGH